jgi:DNA-binding NarL/FixJ family response regulator
MTKISILLVDDHALVRRGFRRLLEDDPNLQVVGEAGSGQEAVQAAAKLRPQVVVMDMAMPGGMDGLEATRQIVSRLPETGVLMLSMYGEENYVRNALEAGARGYLLKNALDVDLAAAVKAVADGETYVTPQLRAARTEPSDAYNRLRPREKQILQLIGLGKSNKEIAVLLGLSVNTVNVHRAKLMETLNIHRTAELVLYAVKRGLVTPA